MYTIGQVAKFLGISRDTIKYYEEKALVKPQQNSENGYRTYNRFDIYDLTTVNFYRELDLEIKKIQELRKGKSIEGIQLLLEEKEQEVLEEIAYKKLLLKKLQIVKEDCQKIQQYLGTYTIKEMKPLAIMGTIDHYTAYEEYDALKENTDSLKKAVILTSLRRVIRFNEQGMQEDKFMIVKKLEENEKALDEQVLFHPKCLYTVIEDGRWSTGGKNTDDKVEATIRKVAKENGYELLGLVYINLLLATYEEGLERIFLEMYVPIK
ncbi:MerR family transcriptional regulator [Lysinibacillus sp. ZYM-1]|uniref:MerR family transcriptional regulator n=1 Tax=Lysinibacillus sp. ZYM-1 TaxID=1681184 RepID=UPI0006CE8338|nr:MerR family transcriptional regulator [Lysinibacillus sp. ZYM-1]KPN89660.1 MerR family transcriptional regulator [Lysinibacillus sp. ZYM-1]